MITGTIKTIAPAATILPATWLSLDIETGDAPDLDVQAALEGWRPPANIKDPSKIAERRREAEQKITDRAALLDSSPILCVCARSNFGALAFNGMDDSRPEIQGWQVTGCGNEREMLCRLRVVLDEYATPETTIVGHNVRWFDLPKLRHAYIRHRLRLPEVLKPRFRDEERAEVVDTMSLFKSFSMENRDSLFVSLDTVCTALGILRPKTIINGADVPRLHRQGKYLEILTYCAIDAEATTRAYLLMTGQAEDLT